VIPARNGAITVARVADAIAPEVDEVLVVDSCSSDRAADVAASVDARVFKGKKPGRYYAMPERMRRADGNVLVFVDADLIKLIGGLAQRLPGSLTPGASLAKGYYRSRSSTPGPSLASSFLVSQRNESPLPGSSRHGAWTRCRCLRPQVSLWILGS
jgi:glucosyl-3-phosphoglycerate synthase